MSAPDRISSRANPLVKHLRLLASDRQTRQTEGLFIGEGAVMLGEALRSGLTVCDILFDDRAPAEPLDEAKRQGAKLWPATTEIVAHCSSVVSPQGIVFSAQIPRFPAPAGKRFLALDGVADPGNMGTILRTADAFGCDGVFLTAACADRYAPKVVRSAMGALFRLKTYTVDSPDIPALVKKLGLPLYGTTLSDDSVDVGTVDLGRGCIVLGNEANGVSKALLDVCDRRIHIPMTGPAESLNVAVAAGIVCYLSQSQA